MTHAEIPAFDAQELDPEFEERAVNTIRMLAVDAVEKAESGHPGLPMGMARAATVLWTQFLRYSPSNPSWNNRDRFILSAGHGSMLLYALLHLTGYDLPLDELKNFRQLHSKTPGHPEYGETPGVETTTGPLGQGFANGVGMAIAESWLAHRYNRPGYEVVDHYTYAIVSDGDLMEGIAQEAASLAGHLRLSKLIYLYDDNEVTIDGNTSLAFTEDVYQRFEAYGWHVQKIDGMDRDQVAEAIEAAHADPRPSLIGCKTIIGFGNPEIQGTAAAHSDAFGEKGVAATRKNLKWPDDPTFHVPDDVGSFFGQAVDRGKSLEEEYNELFKKYAEDHSDLAAELCHILAGDLPDGWEEHLPAFEVGDSQATRNASGTTLNALAEVIPNLIGGSADLAPSNKTDIKGADDFGPDKRQGRVFRFGVREHAMGGILNGMALHGGVLPYGGTFLVFSDYMRPSIRLAALMGAPVTYIFTHDSVGVGEDGPTHQPVEQLLALRAIPNLTVFRPADANETAQAWRQALLNRNGPTALVLTRQKVPVFDRSAPGMGAAEQVSKGAYTLFESESGPDILLLASGSEVELAYDAGRKLDEEGIGVRVVSMPSWELLAHQGEDYQHDLIPLDLPAVAVEAGVTLGWERWIGRNPKRGQIIGVDRFGASAPYSDVYQELGLTVERVLDTARSLLKA